VNIVQTRHKVFAILGEASASSPSNYTEIKLISILSPLAVPSQTVGL